MTDQERASQILDQLEAGIVDAGGGDPDRGEGAWYGFIALDDVRWALRTLAEMKEAACRRETLVLDD